MLAILTWVIIGVCVAAFAATWMVGRNPEQRNYGKTTKARMIRLTAFYVLTVAFFVVLLIVILD